MYLSRESAKILYEKTKQSYSMPGIGEFVDSRLIDGFQEQLKIIANQRNYKEGEKIMPSDLDLITDTVDIILGEMKDKMIANSEKMPVEMRLAYTPFYAMVTANDYLFAMAMQALGCPDIPESFGRNVTNHIKLISNRAELDAKPKEYNAFFSDEIYQKQRGVNAKDVLQNTEMLRKSIEDKTASPMNFAQYAAEYYALRRRQADHTGIWKFFHREENKKRDQLLKSMEAVIAAALPKWTLDFKFESPASLTHSYNDQLIDNRSKKVFSKNAIASRNQISEDLFKHEPTTSERALNDNENAFAAVVLDEEARALVHFEPGTFTDFGANGKEIDLSSKVEEFVFPSPIEKDLFI